jgi:hypothetical protein
MRFRPIAAGLAAVMAAALGVPAAASAATGPVPPVSYGPNPGHEAPPAGPAAGPARFPGSRTGRNRGTTRRARSARSA